MSLKTMIRQPLYTEMAWSKKRQVYFFRLLHGDRQATPPLKIDPYGMLLLQQGCRLDLFDKDGKKWIQLGSNRRTIEIFFEPHKAKGIAADFLTQWPELSFAAFMGDARRLRGAEPSEGWEKVVENELDQQRTG
jgi:hypothetical protein